jgi:hypothetical protein
LNGFSAGKKNFEKVERNVPIVLGFVRSQASRRALFCIATLIHLRLMSQTAAPPANLSIRRRFPSRTTMRIAGWCVIGLIAFCYLWFVRKHCAPYASNVDASGYVHSARLLLEGKLTALAPPIEGLSPPAWTHYFQEPFGFAAVGPADLVPTYPVGYPLHLVLASFFVGLDWAAVLVNVIAAAAAGILMTTLGRQFGLPWVWSLAGTALLWASPVVIYLELWAMSDVTSMIWCMATISASLFSAKAKRWAAAAGMAFGIAVLVRPTNLLLILPLALTLGLRWRVWLIFILAGLPAAAFLIWYNWSVYGAVLVTGYGNNGWAFAGKYFIGNAKHFIIGIPLLLSPVVLLALGLPLLIRRQRSIVALLAIWIGVFIGFYVFYYFSGLSWWFIRFLMPAFPAFIIAALLVCRHGIEKFKRPRMQIVAPLLLLFGALSWEIVAAHRLNSVIMKRGEIVYLQTVQWMKDHAEPDAIVVTRIASGSFFYYSNFTIVRYDLAGSEKLGLLYAAANQTGRPVYAVVGDGENKAAFGTTLHDSWTEQARHGMLVIWKRVSGTGGAFP